MEMSQGPTWQGEVKTLKILREHLGKWMSFGENDALQFTKIWSRHLHSTSTQKIGNWQEKKKTNVKKHAKTKDNDEKWRILRYPQDDFTKIIGVYRLFLHQ